MRIADNRADVAVGGALETSRATIRASSKVFGFFANQTYSNKEQAIIREYVANGMDAHAMTGYEGPVEVWMPDPDDVSPTLTFRDYGPGMSHEFMMTSFMAYADGTTKNADDTQIGGFGIGSKSGLAYSDSFSMTVFFEGTVRVYVMYQDEDGCPSLSLLSSRDMRPDERSGVEVQLPIKPTDCAAFQTAAHVALSFFEPLPVVHNIATPLEAPTYISEGPNWGMRKTAGPIQVIMGGVAYPVQAAVKARLTDGSAAEKLFDYGLDVRAPIGTCSPSLSREALSLDADTIRGIESLLEGVAVEVASRLATVFDHHETKWAAVKDLGEQIGNGYSSRSRYLSEHARWRGESIQPNIGVPRAPGSEFWYVQPKSNWKGWRTDKPNFEAIYQINPWRIQQVLVDDLPIDWAPSKRRIGARVTAWANANCTVEQRQHKAILVTRRVNLDDLGNPDVVYLSTVTPVSLERGEKRVKGAPATVYQTAYSWFWSGRSNSLSGYGRDTVADVPDGGTYVEMTNFQLPDNFWKWQDFLNLPRRSIYFVNKGEIRKLDENWVNMEDTFKARLAVDIAAEQDLPERLWFRDQVALNELRGWNRLTPPADSALATLLGYKKVRDEALEKLNRFVGYVEPHNAGVDIPALFDQLSPKVRRLLRLLNAGNELDIEIMNEAVQ